MGVTFGCALKATFWASIVCNKKGEILYKITIDACKYYFDKFAVGMKLGMTVVFKLARNQRVLKS